MSKNVQVLKEKIIECLRESNLTISEIQFKINKPKKSIEKIINKDLKPNNIIIEINKFYKLRSKHKIYILNTPKSIYQYLDSLFGYYYSYRGEICEESIKWEARLEYLNFEFYKRWEKKLKFYSKIFRSFQNRIDSHFNLLDVYRSDFKEKKDDDGIRIYGKLELILFLEGAISDLVKKFHKWKRKATKFYSSKF